MTDEDDRPPQLHRAKEEPRPDREAPFELELPWCGRRAISIEPLGKRPLSSRDPLPQLLISIAPRLARIALTEDLDQTCEPAAARSLVAMAWERAREFDPHARDLPADIDAAVGVLPARELVAILARVVAAGLTYDSAAAQAFQQRSLRLVSTIVRDLHIFWRGAAIRVAKGALGRRPRRAVCRHYAAAIQTLFFAFKRATGAYGEEHLVPIYGRAFVQRNGAHAWNLLVDASTRTLTAVDGTIGDGDAVRRRHHVSGLLGTAIHAATELGPLAGSQMVPDLVYAAIDPETEQGLHLLYCLADHHMTGNAIRDRIARHLAAREFSRFVPVWQLHLEQRKRAMLNRMWGARDQAWTISRLQLAGH